MLSDLDELVLSCEDPRSRLYIEEAVRCYKAGAYRSSVVACWIAVAFDLVDKIKELAAGGDKEAQAELTRFETIQKANNLPGALAFEKELPLMARDKFEFISHLEYLDVVRLVEDRNRCAHPSQVSDSHVFTASAELARLHIYNAVNAILSKPATQGKSALERILNDLDSKFFPGKLDDVLTLLEAGPLKKCRESLYNNLLKILIKTALGEQQNTSKFGKCSLALQAVKKMHPNFWDKFFTDCATQITERARTDDALYNAVVAIVRLGKINIWRALPKAEQLRFLTFVENAPKQLLYDLDWFYIIKTVPIELIGAASKRIMKASFSEIESMAWFATPPVVLDRLTSIYLTSNNFAEANTYGRTIRLALQDITPTHEQAEELARVAGLNDQIKNSIELPNIFKYMSTTELGKDTILKLIADHKLPIEL